MGFRTIEPATAAEAYLHLLKDRGIEIFLGNAGTDFASLVEAFARFEAEGQPGPRPLVVPHEFVAVSMAHGYYVAGGRPAAVMVHVNVGTANASTAIITASRANVPILMTAGRTPITEEGLPGSRDLHIHWAQESFDQAAMLREYVKWDYELRTPAQLESVVDRALEMMLAAPRGPVYLTLPREVLAARRRRDGGSRASASLIPRGSRRRRASSPGPSGRWCWSRPPASTTVR
jgi:acetolactate synthase I/II/III large subunit